MDERKRKRVGAGLPPDCRKVTQGVAFFDLTGTAAWAAGRDDEKVAGVLQEFYRLSAERIGGAGGRVVKFIGDAGLAVFPRGAVEKAVFALAGLSSEVRRMAAERGFETRLNIGVHFGPMLEGSFGAPGSGRYDVLGKEVNAAARLGRRGVTLSGQAFRCLGKKARARFESVEPPAAYRLRERAG